MHTNTINKRIKPMASRVNQLAEWFSIKFCRIFMGKLGYFCEKFAKFYLFRDGLLCKNIRRGKWNYRKGKRKETMSLNWKCDLKSGIFCSKNGGEIACFRAIYCAHPISYQNVTFLKNDESILLHTTDICFGSCSCLLVFFKLLKNVRIRSNSAEIQPGIS